MTRIDRTNPRLLPYSFLGILEHMANLIKEVLRPGIDNDNQQ